MTIEVSDEDVQALGVADKGALTSFLEKFETDRTKARQSVIDKTQAELRAYSDLGLTPEQIKALKDKPAGASDDDVQKRVDEAIKAARAEDSEKANARARGAEVRAQAAEMGFVKPAQALALINQSELAKVKVGDDGEADADAVKALLEALKTDSPHLLKPTDTTTDHRTAGIGATGSGTKPEVQPGLPRLRDAYANSSKK